MKSYGKIQASRGGRRGGPWIELFTVLAIIAILAGALSAKAEGHDRPNIQVQKSVVVSRCL